MPISEIVAPCLSIGPKPSLIIEVSIMAFVLNIVNMPIILGKVKECLIKTEVISMEFSLLE